MCIRNLVHLNFLLNSYFFWQILEPCTLCSNLVTWFCCSVYVRCKVKT